MRDFINALLLSSLVAGGGCAVGAQKCLETPISSKVSDERVEGCRQALEANLDRQDLFHQYVGLMRVRSQYDDIVSWSRRVLKRDRSRTDALYNLAYGLRKTGKCQTALKGYRAYAKRNKEDPDPYFGMGLCHEELGNAQAAIDAFQSYVEKETRKDQQAWVDRAKTRIAALQGGGLRVVNAAPARPTPSRPPGVMKPPLPLTAAPKAQPPVPPPAPTPPPVAPPVAPPPAAATTDCSTHIRTFKADPFNTAAYDKYGDCALGAGQHDDVIKWMRIGTRDNPDFSRGFYHLARAFKAKGQVDHAKGYFAKACNAGVPEACAQ